MMHRGRGQSGGGRGQSIFGRSNQSEFSGRGGGRGGRGGHFGSNGDRGGGNHGGQGRGGISSDQKAQIAKATRPTSIQVSSDGTDDIIVASSAGDKILSFARLVLSRDNFVNFSSRQMREFVNSCLLNLSNHHSVDVSGLLPLLASKSGSARLKDIMLMPMGIDVGLDSTRISFQFVALPLVGVLTREAVCMTTMGNESGVIYSTVYNYRETFIEDGVIPCMEQLLSRGSLADPSPGAAKLQREDDYLCVVSSLSCALLAVVRLVYQIVTRIRDARTSLSDAVRTLSKLVQTCMKISVTTERDRFINNIMVNEMNKLVRIVADAEDAIIPELEVAAVDRTSRGGDVPMIRALHLAFDPPGTLSDDGPRHDNDHSEIADISILPTQQEIICGRPPFLPSNLPDAPHFLAPGWKRQIDTHFRLYREDMMDPLRRSITSFLAALYNTPFGEEDRLLVNKQLRKVLDNNVNLNAYGNVEVVGMIMEKHAAGNIEISFSQPAQILGASKERRSVLRRTEFWKRSKNRLMHGGLVCLISRTNEPTTRRGDAENDFQLILAVIANRNDEALAKDDQVARIHITLANPLQYLDLLNSEASSKHWFLVESPGAYFGSYRPILKALQLSIPASFPFGKYLAATAEELLERGNIVDPPIYARAPTFKYDLSVLLKGRPCDLDVNNIDSVQQAVRSIQGNGSTLDQTQAVALVDTLCREVALINGPPGTGKTWIGVALMQVLLANKEKSEIGPILCICYTNHALDQFLEHLLEKKIDKIVRVGARSQSEKLEPYNLQALMMSYDKPYSVRTCIRNTIAELESASKKIKDLERDILGDCVKWNLLASLLSLDHPVLFDQFNRSIKEYSNRANFNDFDLEDGFTRVEDKRPTNRHPFDRWKYGLDVQEITDHNKKLIKDYESRVKSLGNPRQNKNQFELLDDEEEVIPPSRPILRSIPVTNRPVEMLHNVDIWKMSMRERRKLLDLWRPEVQKTLMVDLGKLIKDVEALNDKKNGANDEVRRGILRQCEVVGMTTNGAAKSQELIKKLAPKVIICEEAGEVLESHILSALSSSTQHLILIGDHKQLRPQIETYNLQSDSPVGKKYSLDKSLFERLVTLDKNPLPMSILTTQRRMRPCISNLIRKPLYPNLEDGDSVKNYPHICGMNADLYFMHHTHSEDTKDDAFGMQSYSSTFEANMATQLATYLIKNGYDKPGDIAILTPYLGQLSKLRDALKRKVMVVLDERDQDQLDQKELDEGGEIQETVHIQNGTKVGTKNILLQKQVTLRTIDNYQGEEAKIIIISLVRNNVANDPMSSGNIGFLKSPNRTNVLLSRAQHGMFIMGNAFIMDQEKNGIWPSVIKELRTHDRVGDGFPIQCKQHPDTIRLVDSVDSFKIMSPNGGCNVPCGRGMSCGHICPLQCHPDDADHRLVKCFQPCDRLHPICQHACPKECGQECGDCNEVVEPLLLKCGHVLERPLCHQQKNPSKVVCRVKVTRKLPTCEHEHEMQCHQDSAKVKCDRPCASPLPCGHSCIKRCSDCQKASVPKMPKDLKSKEPDLKLKEPVKVILRTNHGSCETKCGSNLFCGHTCDNFCHPDNECPACKQVCAVACTHRTCHLSCDTACAACSVDCSWTCKHQGRCRMPCGVPCDRLPCNERCDKSLGCGHQCPSVCGEACPPSRFCVECKDPATMNMEVDMIMMASLGETDVSDDPILVLACGHALTMSTLDGLMEMNQYYVEGTSATGSPVYTAKRALPGGEVRQVSCPSCRKPIVQLLRYGRRIKDAQLSMRLKKYQVIQENNMAGVRNQYDVAKALFDQNRVAFLQLLSKIKAESCDDPPSAKSRELGKFAQETDLSPNTVFWNINAIYKVPQEHRDAWNKHMKTSKSLTTKLSHIHNAAAKSPTKQLFEAAVARLYRLQKESMQIQGTEQDANADKETASTIIQKCIRQCGLPADGNGGSSFAESLAEKTNTLMLVLSEASSAMEAVGPKTGWYFFVEDLLNCCLTYSRLTMEAAEKGNYNRRMAYSRVNLLYVLCEKVRWLGLRPIPTTELQARKTREKFVDRLLETFTTEISVLRTTCPRGIEEECLKRAAEIEGRMTTAVKIANGSLDAPLTKEEKVQVFRAVSAALGGSGHWYRCPNGHTYVIGECGMAMMESTCPECGARVGGGDHSLRQDNTVDNEYEALYRQAA